MNLFLRWLLSALSLLIVGSVIPGIHLDSFWAALITAFVLGVFNIVLRPLLILLTLPVTILTLGLFTLVINAGIFLLASTIVKGFTVDSFGAALLGSLLLWFINWGLSGLLRPLKEKPPSLR